MSGALNVDLTQRLLSDQDDVEMTSWLPLLAGDVPDRQTVLLLDTPDPASQGSIELLLGNRPG